MKIINGIRRDGYMFSKHIIVQDAGVHADVVAAVGNCQHLRWHRMPGSFYVNIFFVVTVSEECNELADGEIDREQPDRPMYRGPMKLPMYAPINEMTTSAPMPRN